MLADGPSSLTATRAATEVSNTAKKQSEAPTAAKPTTTTTTNEPSTLTPPDAEERVEEHVYEDPNKLPQQEELDVYVNSRMVISSPDYQRERQQVGAGGKRLSNTSIRDDSGLGEDDTWEGELLSLKGEWHCTSTHGMHSMGVSE